MLGELTALADRRLPRTLLVELQKLHYPRHVRRFFEPDVEIVRRLLAPGDSAIDIGAHVGWYTKVLSDSVGSDGCVYSIEPIPTTFTILIHCLKSLKLTNVRALQLGISDADRKAVMFVPRQSGNYNFYQSRIAAQDPTEPALRVSVELRSIDSIFNNSLENIAFMKCDVEGHDLEALKGASRLLTRCKPSLLVEVSADPDVPGTRGHHLCMMLRELGYSPWWYDGIRLRPRKTGDCPINHFFLTDSQLSRLCGQGVLLGQPAG